jgi:hypothetical protein
MKHIKKIIGLALILILATQPVVPLTYAAELTEPEKACQNEAKELNYGELIKTWNDAKVKDQNTYKSAFEEAQTAYHNYIGCMFNFAEGTLLKSDSNKAKITSGFPIFSTVMDWMSPSQGCLKPEELKKLVQKTDPSQMLGPILQSQSDYRNYLNQLMLMFYNSGTYTDAAGAQLSGLNMIQAKSASFGTLIRQNKMEVQSSLLAIDIMFTSLKELRLSLVMHVQFQCTLKFLEGYRKALEELRKVIDPLPALLEDASITK